MSSINGYSIGGRTLFGNSNEISDGFLTIENGNISDASTITATQINCTNLSANNYTQNTGNIGTLSCNTGTIQNLNSTNLITTNITAGSPAGNIYFQNDVYLGQPGQPDFFEHIGDFNQQGNFLTTGLIQSGALSTNNSTINNNLILGTLSSCNRGTITNLQNNTLNSSLGTISTLQNNTLNSSLGTISTLQNNTLNSLHGTVTNLLTNTISSNGLNQILNIPTTNYINYGGQEIRFQNSSSARMLLSNAYQVISSGQTGIYYAGTNNRIGLCNITNPAYTCEINGDTNLRNSGVLRINNNTVLSSTGLGSGVLTASLNTISSASGTLSLLSNTLQANNIISSSGTLTLPPVISGNPTINNINSSLSTLDSRTNQLTTSGTTTSVSGNLFIAGNLTLTGNVVDVDTEVIVTDAMKIDNAGTQDALVVNQANTSLNNILDLRDNGVSVLRVGAGGTITNTPLTNSLTSLQTENSNQNNTLTAYGNSITNINSSLSSLDSVNVLQNSTLSTLNTKTNYLSSGTLNSSTFTGRLVCDTLTAPNITGLLSNGTVQNGLLTNNTINGLIQNSGTIQNGTLLNNTLSGIIQNNATIQSGSLLNNTLSGIIQNNATIQNGTLRNNTLTGFIQNNATIQNGTFSGNLVANDLIIGNQGIDFSNPRTTHVNADGAIYRYNGQSWLTVDDNWYIRDQTSDNSDNIKFYFDTNDSRLGIGGQPNTFANLMVYGDIGLPNNNTEIKFGTGGSGIRAGLNYYRGTINSQAGFQTVLATNATGFFRTIAYNTNSLNWSYSFNVGYFASGSYRWGGALTQGTNPSFNYTVVNNQLVIQIQNNNGNTAIWQICVEREQ